MTLSIASVSFLFFLSTILLLLAGGSLAKPQAIQLPYCNNYTNEYIGPDWSEAIDSFYIENQVEMTISYHPTVTPNAYMNVNLTVYNQDPRGIQGAARWLTGDETAVIGPTPQNSNGWLVFYINCWEKNIHASGQCTGYFNYCFYTPNTNEEIYAQELMRIKSLPACNPSCYQTFNGKSYSCPSSTSGCMMSSNNGVCTCSQTGESCQECVPSEEDRVHMLEGHVALWVDKFGRSSGQAARV